MLCRKGSRLYFLETGTASRALGAGAMLCRKGNRLYFLETGTASRAL